MFLLVIKFGKNRVSAKFCNKLKFFIIDSLQFTVYLLIVEVISFFSRATIYCHGKNGEFLEKKKQSDFFTNLFY